MTRVKLNERMENHSINSITQMDPRSWMQRSRNKVDWETKDPKLPREAEQVETPRKPRAKNKN